MYQLEVKAALAAALFRPADGWKLTVDVDAMERANGGSQAADKREKATRAENQLRSSGAAIGAHPAFGRADMVAEHLVHGIVVVEVEGDSSRQREQAMYSALGQTLLMMTRFADGITYGIAVPDREDWIRQIEKVPPAAIARLGLKLWLVSDAGVRELGGA